MLDLEIISNSDRFTSTFPVGKFLFIVSSDLSTTVPVIVITGADLDENDKKFLSSETSRVLEKSSMSDTGIADHLVKTIESVAGVGK